MSLDELMNVKISVGARGDSRTTINSLVPIKVISSNELEVSGFITTGEAIQSLLPSFNYYRTSITDGTDHIAPATFNGMGTDQVLVLVNGKRWHHSALLHMNATVGRGSTSIDFDAIPLSAIGRIEILPDGASAQYGSDAIAGIINIVFKTGFKSGTETYISQTSEKDGIIKAYNFSLLFDSDDKFSMGILAEYTHRGATNRARSYARQQYFDGDPRNNDPEVLNRTKFRYGDAASHDFNLVYDCKYLLDEYTELYTYGLMSMRQGEAGGFFRRPKDDRNVRSIYPDGFLPLIAPDMVDNSIVAGINSKDIHGWTGDVAISFSSSRFDFNVKNSLNTSYGAQSQREFYCGSQKHNQLIFSADMFKSFDISIRNPLDVGLGAEYRREHYFILEGEKASYTNGNVPILDGPNQGDIAPVGTQVYPGYSPDDAVYARRTNLAAYVDIENSLSSRLRVGVAGRFEEYSDFGTTLNGKLSLHLQILKNLTVRATASTGFRAPSLAQSYFTTISSVFTAGAFYDVGTYGVYHPLAKSLGATLLKPEKSIHHSLGITYQLGSNLEIQADFYSIILNDKILITEDFVQDHTEFGPEIPVILESYGVAGARYFTNAVDTKTNGINCSVRYQWHINAGQSFLFNLMHHYNSTNIEGDVRTPDILKEYKTTTIGTNDITRITDVQPKSVSHFGISYLSSKFQLNIKLIRFGSFYGDVYSGNKRSYYQSKILTNITGKYKLNHSVYIQAGSNNVLNVYPDKRSGEGLLPSVLPYPQYSPFGFRGSMYYLKLGFIF
ncbi:TonB-dependent receptor [bacterium]|nr:TonB-dependent receptor [bacterium]